MARDRETAINSYITDMLSLEDHISKALKGQINDLKNHPDLAAEIRQVSQLVEHHIADLRSLAERRKAGGVAEAVKRAGAAVAGAAAGIIDLVRTEGLPKDLRDDYTAFSLATVSYVMLLSSAMSLNDQPVSELAERHLKQYTKVVMKLNNILPSAVIAELREEGLPAREEQLPAIARTLKGVWSDPYNEVPEVDEISVA